MRNLARRADRLKRRVEKVRDRVADVGSRASEMLPSRAGRGGRLRHLLNKYPLPIGVGAIVRHTAGAVAILFGVLLIIPGLVQLLPAPWNNDITLYLPSSAGAAMSAVVHFPNLLGPTAGFLVLLAYAAATLGVALVLLVRRDA